MDVILFKDTSHKYGPLTFNTLQQKTHRSTFKNKSDSVSKLTDTKTKEMEFILFFIIE